MVKEKRFEKVVEWKEEYSYWVLFMWIILSPILAPIIFIRRIKELHNKYRKIYWREIK